MKKISIFSLLLLSTAFFQGCQDQNKDVEPDTVTLTDPNELSKVMVIPGATLEKGTPPPVTSTSDTPKLSTTTPEVNAISGQEATFSFDYSNAVGKITVIYIQFEGADSYFKIPLSGNSGTNGTIRIPMRIPEKYTAVPSGKSFGRFCCFAGNSASVMRQAALCNNSFTSNLPPRPGKSTVNIGGRNYDGTAVCDFDLGGLGRGFGIQINDDKIIILYNLKRGSNSQLYDVLSGTYNVSSGVPWAAFFDGNNLYYSVSGNATYSGNVVSMSGRFEDLNGRQVNLTASGNCQ